MRKNTVEVISSTRRVNTSVRDIRKGSLVPDIVLKADDQTRGIIRVKLRDQNGSD